MALPKTSGLLFGIHVENHPLTKLKADATLAGRFCRALETMPEALARYKGVFEARADILGQMRA